MGGWMEALADKVHKQEEHIPQHCYISHNHFFWQISCFCSLVTPPPTHLRLMRHPRTCTDKWRPTATLGLLSFTIEKRWSYVTVTLKTKCKSTTPRDLPGYWRQFRTQHLSRYSARLVEESLDYCRIFDLFRFATLK